MLLSAYQILADAQIVSVQFYLLTEGAAAVFPSKTKESKLI